MLPELLPVAPVTTRFAFARDRLAQGVWESSYRLSSGHQWWRCLRLSRSRGALHPCAERLAKHLSWQLGDRVSLTNIRAVLGGYAAYHHCPCVLRGRTGAGWWRRAGWHPLRPLPTRDQANSRDRDRAGLPATCSPPQRLW